MAFLGLFGNDEEEVQQPQRKSGIGNFLMSALKLALVAVAAVVTLGLIFKNDTAKNFVDGFTGGDGKGDGKGAASWITNLFDKGLQKTKEFFGISNTPAPDSVAEIVKVGNRQTILPKKDGLVADRIVIDPELRKKLSDQEKALAEVNDPKRLLTAQQKSVEFKKLEELPQQSFALAEKISVWDITARLNNQGNLGSGLPSAPDFKLEEKLPVISQKFNELGRAKAGDSWENLTNLNKIKILNAAVKEAVANKPDLGERSLKEPAGILNGNMREIFLPDRVISKEESSTIVRNVPILSMIFQGKEHITDKGMEITSKEKIGELLERGDLDKALAISNGMQEKFQKTAVAVPTNVQNKDGTWMELSKDEKARAEQQMILYKSASESFGKISEYISNKIIERDFDKEIANPTHKVVAEIAATIPTVFKDYEQKLASYKSGSNMAVDATTEEERQKKLQTAYAKSLSEEANNRDLMTALPKKPEKATGIIPT